jgi:integrase
MAVDRETSCDVRIWKTEVYSGKRVTTHTVRWAVAGRSWKEPHRSAALAETFRSELITAMRRGEPFDVATGRPLSTVRSQVPSTSWYEFACSYVDMKWKGASPKHRKSIAESLISVTPVMLDTEMAPATAKAVRSALLNWGFNARRGSSEQPAAVTERLAWVASHSRPVTDLSGPELVRAALDAIATKLDGTRAAGRTATVKRANFSTALNYAVELGILESNPVRAIKWRAPKSTRVVDRRAVANPDQARLLLSTVAVTPRSGAQLVAFFAFMYYSALRPEEAVNVREHWLDLPPVGQNRWGWMTLEKAAPETGRQWSDTDARRDERELKHRAAGETRRVPIPPALVEILRHHLDEYGTDDEGRLFRGERGGLLAGVTYTRLWDRARAAALTEEQYASPLARRPYDLRHAAVSTWINGGVAPTQVAEWAGHSVDVLLRIYAKCIDGQEDIALRRIDEALGRSDKDEPDHQPSERTVESEGEARAEFLGGR